MSTGASNPIRVGVIGLGVGERHIVGYREIPGVEVAGICDIDPAKMAAVAERQEVSDLHKDYRTLLADPSIDAVSICSYDDHHVEQAVTAFEAGKHVFCEKPVALDRNGLDRVVRAWSDSGKRLSSNLILRQSPRFIAVRDMVQAGEFGDLHYMEGDYIHQILWKITEGWRGKMDFYCVTYGGGIHLIDLMDQTSERLRKPRSVYLPLGSTNRSNRSNRKPARRASIAYDTEENAQ